MALPLTYTRELVATEAELRQIQNALDQKAEQAQKQGEQAGEHGDTGMTSHQGASEDLLRDILTELRQMKTSLQASEVKLRFLERGETSFLLL